MDHPNVEWVPLFEENIYLSVPGSYLENEHGIIDLREVENLPFIGLTKHYSFRQFTDQFCESVGFTPEYHVEVEEATTILQLVRTDAELRLHLKARLIYTMIKYLKIINGKFTRTIGLLKHRYLYPTKLSEEFVAHCVRYFEEYKKNKR